MELTKDDLNAIAERRWGNKYQRKIYASLAIFGTITVLLSAFVYDNLIFLFLVYVVVGGLWAMRSIREYKRAFLEEYYSAD